MNLIRKEKRRKFDRHRLWIGRAGIVAFVLMLLVCTGCTPKAQYLVVPGFCFRRTTWRMNSEMVILTEGRDPDEQNEDELCYRAVSFGPFYCDLYYTFENDTLSSALYMFYIADSLSPMNDYHTAREMIRDFYGQAVTNSTVWLGVGTFDRTDENVRIGRMRLSCVWKDNYSQITLNLKGANGNVYLTLEYIPLSSVQ